MSSFLSNLSAKYIKAESQDDQAIGEKLIEVLGLKVKSNGRVDTSWGDKTPSGLSLTVKRIIENKD